MPRLTDFAITPEAIKAHGLKPEEYEKIKVILGREPNITELGMFSAMWSEHCSYKCSKRVLKIFPTSSDRALVKAGDENAGVIDIGDGMAIVFKIESHNHPSAIEPFQGATTGVGGIMRDIFTMGARPVINANSLRFGSLDNPETKRLLKGVVAGIAHYGNCMGVPTTGGEVYFDEVYEGNPLVNAFCLGIVRHEDLTMGAAGGIGNPVYYVGAATGRDGIGGASFASKELSETSDEDRPSVQVGDPFIEKLLLEACLEVLPRKIVFGMQDMGAAGLTCSTTEPAARGDVGMDIDLSKVPRRESGMNAYEMMISESQERMLVIVKKGNEKEVEDIFEKWDLHAVQIGTVTDTGRIQIVDNGELVVDVPAKALTTEAPLYHCEEKEPAYLKEVQGFDPLTLPDVKDPQAAFNKLLDSPSLASKEWVYSQYDHMVRTDSIFLPGHSASLNRIKGTNKGLAVSCDCNGLFVYLDPYEGGKIAVAEAIRNVVCTGAVPLGITDCLNFGNPEDPEIFWQFHRAAEGIRDACLAFGVPVTGGNVSLYNESPKGAVYPTPTIAVVGLLDDIDLRMPSYFQSAGERVFLLGKTLNELGGTHYLMLEHGLKKGLPPRLDFKTEKKLHDFLLACAAKKIIRSCRDLSEGGLAFALAESCFGPTSWGIDASQLKSCMPAGLRLDAFLFGETQSRVIVSIKPEDCQSFLQQSKEAGIETLDLGIVTQDDQFLLGDWIKTRTSQLKRIWDNAIPRRLEGELPA